MAEKPQQESFLAQLSEVEVISVPVQHQSVEVLQISPVFDAKVDALVFSEDSNYMKPENIPGQAYHVGTHNTEVASSVATSSTTVSSQPTNGNIASKVENSPRASNQTPQTVTGNVKIQLMEISVDEFKANVEYIQQQFPSLPRRLVCDAFSKANFDCNSAMELLAREQEKKDQTIVPPMVAAAAAAAAAATTKHQQQQQLQQLNQRLQGQTPKSTAAAAAAAAVDVDVVDNATETVPGAAGPTPSPLSSTAGAAASVGQSPSVAAAAASAPQTPRATGGGGRVLPLPHGPRSRRSQAGAPKEDPCYRRVVSADKDAERALRQKLKSHVRSRVFSHGVKISQGRETAETVHQQHLDGENQEVETIDSPTSPDDGAAAGSAAMTPTSLRVFSSPASRSTPGSGGRWGGSRRLETADAGGRVDRNRGAETLQSPPIEDDGTPQSALRILRDSFPNLDEARIAETLSACDQDVDAAIRVLSGRPIVPGSSGGDSPGSGGAGRGGKFFKSRAQQQAAARRSYVRSELSTGAWMDQRAAAALSKAAAAAAAAASPATAAAGAGGRVAAALPTATSLRTFVVQPKRRIKDEAFAHE